MTEIRIDPITGLRVIVSTEGEVPASDRGGMGVVAATHPLLRDDSPDPPPQDNPDLFGALAAGGADELIAVQSASAGSLAELQVDELRAAAETWRERMRAHGGAAYVHLGVDEDPPSARIEARLLALRFVPAAVARERERFGAHAVRTMGGNLLEDIVGEEVRRRARIVAIDDEAVLLCPYASRHPFQLMLAPRRRRERFQDDGATGAALLHRGLALLRERFGASPPLSLWVRTAPRDAERFCWRIDVVPRLASAGALELGTGIPANPVAPEAAAAQLRELLSAAR